MLFLLFQLGRETYALEARQVVEVLPLLRMKEIPLLPRGVAGIFNYRGAPVPAIDLSELVLGRAARQRLSTRLIVVQEGEGTEKRLLGLMAEKATETLRCDAKEFTASGLANGEAPYLGPVKANPAGGFIQWIKADQLLTPEIRDVLVKTPAGNSAQ